MRDSEAVAAIAAGDPAGLADAYDRYAGPLHAFCLGILREPADAADVVQDTFVIAVPRMSSLRDPERLRSWLYTVARNECLRRLRGRSLQARLEEAPEVTDEAADVAADVEKAELRALVRQALPGVAPAEQEVLELQLRHGLAGGELASVLGVSRNHAHALMSRARVQLEAALGALVVARAGRRDCPDLDAMLAGWDGQLTVLMRKRINRHMDRCGSCSRRREQELTPSMLLGVAPVLALPLAAALPAGLREQVMHAVFGSSPAAVAHRAGLGQTPYSFGHGGFPQPLHPLHTPWWQAGPMHVGAAAGTATAAAAAVVAGVTLAVVPHHHTAGHHPGGGTSVVATGTSRASAGILPPPANRPRAAGTPTARVVATVSAIASAGASATPGDSGAEPGSSPGEVAASDPASASAAASESPAGTTAGTLSVDPGELDITSPGSGTITLTASGGPVSWSVSVPAGTTKKDGVAVTPTSGTLEAGATVVVTVTVDGPGKLTVHLTFSPGGEIVRVVVG
ncbi:MAG TPA: sigma-70 family RNA polymerase sigma factor [Streptosporangiaceae bacterium]|nr:sigma-70 family RNA polymerase sigma factor [Streptosporangiaceae bacterium]